MEKKSLKDIVVMGKKVFVRVDYNVPMKDGVITNDNRIRATLPTLEYLLAQNAALVLASHLGRPKGAPVPEFTLAPVAKRLSELLGKEVLFAPDCVGEEAAAMAKALKPGQILLLENLRYHKEEEKNDPEFSRQLASLAEVAVNDAFGVSHRAHASVEGITKYIPTVAGFLLEKEILFLGQAVNDPVRPFVAIIGGAKVSDKIGVIENLLTKVDRLIIGGGMANTFLAAKGFATGKSLVEEDKLELARELMAKAKTAGKELLLPVDVTIADRFAADAANKVVAADAIEGSYIVNHLDFNDPEVKPLQEKYTAKYNLPMELNGYMAHDAFLLLKAAIEDAGVADPVKIAESLTKVTVQGVTGTIKLSPEDHNPIGKEAAIVRVENADYIFQEKYGLQ